MRITDPFVLPADVVCRPVAELPASVREGLGPERGEIAVTRPRGRAPTRLVDRGAMDLLMAFVEPATIIEVITRLARVTGEDADTLLTAAFPFLRDCINSRLLVPADSPWAAPVLPLLEVGDALGRWTVVRTVRVLDDTEVHVVREPGGGEGALKLARHAEDDPADRFARERAALARAAGAGAPRLLDHGRWEGRPWTVMDWIVGVPPAIAMAECHDDRARHQLLAAIAAAYARLHAAGILHGDVHPGNILVGQDGGVSLLDFELALPIPPARLEGQDRTGGVVEHEAPERARALVDGEPLPAPTPCSEQFSVATILHRLLIGEPWFGVTLDRREALARIASGAPRPFDATGRLPWPEMERALGRALQREPRARWPSMAEFAGAVAAAAPVPGLAPLAMPDRSALGRLERRFLRTTGQPGRECRSVPGEAPWHSIMHGRAGVAWVLWRLANRRADPQLLASAEAWAAAADPDATEPLAWHEADGELAPGTVAPRSIWHGAGGAALVRALVAHGLDDTRRWTRAIDDLIRHGTSPAGGTDLTMGRAGTLLALAGLLEAAEAIGDGRACARLREVGAPLAAGLDAPTDDGPAMAHGTAGRLVARLRWHAAARSTDPGLGPALATLGEAGTPDGRGLTWPDRGPPRPAHDRIAGWCNGPAGFVLLWIQAHRRLALPGSLELAERAAWATWEAPGRAADLCCGLAGRAWALLAWHRASGDAAWRDRALRLAERGAGRMLDRWRRLTHPYSLFKGTGGLAAFAADLDHPEVAAFPLIDPEGWPSPDPERHG